MVSILHSIPPCNRPLPWFPYLGLFPPPVTGRNHGFHTSVCSPPVTGRCHGFHTAVCSPCNRPLPWFPAGYAALRDQVNQLRMENDELKANIAKMRYGTSSQVGRAYGTSSQAGRAYDTSSQVCRADGASSQVGRTDDTSSQAGRAGCASSQVGRADGTTYQVGRADELLFRVAVSSGSRETMPFAYHSSTGILLTVSEY